VRKAEAHKGCARHRGDQAETNLASPLGLDKSIFDATLSDAKLAGFTRFVHRICDES